MTRYIDAEALKQALIEGGIYPAIVKNTIDRMPTADVVERWEFDALDVECSRLERLEEEYCFGRPKAIQKMVEKLKNRLPAISPCVFDNIAKEVLEEQQDG